VTDIARNMVTRWGMSEQVGVVFADYRADGGGAGLNMQRVDNPAQSRTLIADERGNLSLNGQFTSARQHAFAMLAPSANKPSSVSMASTIDLEVQRILNEGYAIARTLLQDHRDQLIKLADALMEQEQLDRKQFQALLQE